MADSVPRNYKYRS